MNKRSNEILCKDCNENYINAERFKKFGVCLSCQRRMTMAKTHNFKYVPYKDLPQSEKDRLIKQRETNNRWAKKKNAKLKADGDEKKLKEPLSEIDKLSPEFLVATSNKISTVRKPRENQIYTPEIVDEIKATANENISVSELRQIFINKYPDLNITASNFNNIIARHKIPHASRNYGKSNVVKEQVIINPVKFDKIKEDVINDETQVVEEPKHIIKQELDEDGDPIRLQPIKQEVVSVLDEKFKEKKCRNQFNYTVDDYINMLEMFEYLAGNIDGLIKCRDAQFNIVNDYQFDIIHEMENELAEEGNTYLQDKMYVMRDYRRYMDIDYKALKQLRPVLKLIRGMIYPSNPNNLDDPKSISGCLKALKQTISENAQPKFVPRVDVDMTKKYDWAMNKNSKYKKAVAKQLVPQSEKLVQENDLINVENKEPEEKYDLRKRLDEIDGNVIYKVDKSGKHQVVLNTSNVINDKLKQLNSNIRLSEDEIKNGFGVYRVSCRISGGGFGVFRPWYRDYSCVKKEIAMAFAQQEFAKMKSENGQLLFTEIECHKLNVV